MSGICLSIPRAEFNRLCSLFCTQINVRDCRAPDGLPLDALQLLVALGGRESRFGQSLKPRHDPAWDFGGKVWKASLELQAFIAQNGPAGACRYGPLGVMAFHAQGYAVAEMAGDPEAALGGAIVHFNRYVMGQCRCQSLLQICRTWNGGSPSAAMVPGYYEEVLQHYLTEVVSE